MEVKPIRTCAVALVLASLLGSSSASGMPLPLDRILFNGGQAILQLLFGRSAEVKPKHGGDIDLDGATTYPSTPATPPPTPKRGCSIDPDGRTVCIP
jgi:hypothetical protein